MPIYIFIYIRVSTTEQVQALAQQRSIATSYAEYLQKRYPGAIILPIFEDQASAYKIPFKKRSAGGAICKLVSNGSQIVFARLSRAFRNTLDFKLQMKEWEEAGVGVHFIDIGVDCTTSAGRMLSTIMAAVAEAESESLSERQKLAYRQRHIHGTQFPPGCKILLTKIVRPGMHSLTVANEEMIVHLSYVVWLRRKSFLKHGVPDGWAMCADALERLRVETGEIEQYRPMHARNECSDLNLQKYLKRLLTSELPALNTQRLVAYFREGLNPFQLGRKKDGKPLGYKHQPRFRPTLHADLRSQGKPVQVRKPKRWAMHHDACCDCRGTDNKHFAQGRCATCYRSWWAANRSSTNDNG